MITDVSSAAKQCLKSNNGNVGQCQWYFDMLQQCQKNA